MDAKKRLEELTSETANTWVGDLSSRLSQDGRQVAGGWPGTMSEARKRIVLKFRAENVRPGETDLDELAKAVYGAAKREWLSRARPNPSL